MVDTEGRSIVFIIAIIRTIKLQQAARTGQFDQPSPQYCSRSSALLISKGLSFNEQPQQVHRLIYLPKTEQFSGWQLLIKACHPWFCSFLRVEMVKFFLSLPHGLSSWQNWRGGESVGRGSTMVPQFLKQRKVEPIIRRALGTGQL